MSYFDNYFARLNDRLRKVDAAALECASRVMERVGARGGKVIVVGNGGSAAMASHVTVDLTKCVGVRAVNFNEADLLTCFANDYGYEHWVEKALDFYADKKDVVVLISSSGKSMNMLNGAKRAKAMGLPLITLTGFAADNPLRKLGDVNFWVNSQEYNIVEMVHHIWLLAMADSILDRKTEKPVKQRRTAE